jgi:hypothetical protein
VRRKVAVRRAAPVRRAPVYVDTHTNAGWNQIMQQQQQVVAAKPQPPAQKAVQWTPSTNFDPKPPVQRKQAPPQTFVAPVTQPQPPPAQPQAPPAAKPQPPPAAKPQPLPVAQPQPAAKPQTFVAPVAKPPVAPPAAKPQPLPTFVTAKTPEPVKPPQTFVASVAKPPAPQPVPDDVPSVPPVSFALAKQLKSATDQKYMQYEQTFPKKYRNVLETALVDYVGSEFRKINDVVHEGITGQSMLIDLPNPTNVKRISYQKGMTRDWVNFVQGDTQLGYRFTEQPNLWKKITDALYPGNPHFMKGRRPITDEISGYAKYFAHAMLINDFILGIDERIVSPLTVYRGIKATGKAFEQSYLPEKTVEQTFFWSTSLDPAVAAHFFGYDQTCCFLALHLPAGYPIYFRGVGYESEILLPAFSPEGQVYTWIVTEHKKAWVYSSGKTGMSDCYTKSANEAAFNDCNVAFNKSATKKLVNVIHLMPSQPKNVGQPPPPKPVVADHPLALPVPESEAKRVWNEYNEVLTSVDGTKLGSYVRYVLQTVLGGKAEREKLFNLVHEVISGQQPANVVRVYWPDMDEYEMENWMKYFPDDPQQLTLDTWKKALIASQGRTDVYWYNSPFRVDDAERFRYIIYANILAYLINNMSGRYIVNPSLTVYRGTRNQSVKVGNVIEQTSFWVASFDPSVAVAHMTDCCLFELKVDAGTYIPTSHGSVVLNPFGDMSTVVWKVTGQRQVNYRLASNKGLGTVTIYKLKFAGYKPQDKNLRPLVGVLARQVIRECREAREEALQIIGQKTYNYGLAALQLYHNNCEQIDRVMRDAILGGPNKRKDVKRDGMEQSEAWIEYLPDTSVPREITLPEWRTIIQKTNMAPYWFNSSTPIDDPNTFRWVAAAILLNDFILHVMPKDGSSVTAYRGAEMSQTLNVGDDIEQVTFWRVYFDPSYAAKNVGFFAARQLEFCCFLEIDLKHDQTLYTNLGDSGLLLPPLGDGDKMTWKVISKRQASYPVLGKTGAACYSTPDFDDCYKNLATKAERKEITVYTVRQVGWRKIDF